MRLQESSWFPTHAQVAIKTMRASRDRVRLVVHVDTTWLAPTHKGRQLGSMRMHALLRLIRLINRNM